MINRNKCNYYNEINDDGSIKNNIFLILLLLLIFMPPTSEKLKRHIGVGLSVRPFVRLSVRNTFWQLRNSRTAYARVLKLYMWHVYEK